MSLLVYDCEVFKHNWLVVFKNIETGHYTSIWDDNEALETCIDENNVYIGFNNKHYDQFIIKSICAGFTPNEVKKINDDIIVNDIQGWNIPELKDYKFKMQNVDVMDDMQQGLSLKSIEGHLGISIKETDVDFNIDRPLTKEEKRLTELYCKHDVDATQKIYELRKDYYSNKVQLGKLAGLGKVEAMSMTNAKLTAKMLKAQYIEHDDEREYVYPTNLKTEYIPRQVFDFFNKMYDKSIPDEVIFSSKLEFKIGECSVTVAYGGIHGAINNFFWEETKDRGIWNEDVGSYYPHLCTINHYTSRNIPDPKIYEDVLETRMKAKAEGKKAIANALKLVCNTTYGATLNRYNDLYDPLMARSVCISGQLYLLELAVHCYVQIKDLRIVQLNTDGIMVECNKKDYSTLQEICNEWQERTGFELEEDTVVKIAQKDVNNYVEIQPNGNAKAKGGYLVKGIAPAGAFNINNSNVIVATALKEYLVKGTPVEDTVAKCDDILQYQIIAKASSKYKEVYHLVNDKKVIVQKVNRVYASPDTKYGKLYKVKKENDMVAKIESLPEHCIIDNDNQLTIKDIDKNFYIEMAKKRINDFKGIEPEKPKRRKKEMATKKEVTQEKMDYSKLNVYQKLALARKMLLDQGIKQSGKNMQLAYKYFELEDIVKPVTEIFLEIGLTSESNYSNEVAFMHIVNCDNPEQRISFSAPFNQVTPIISNQGKQVTNGMQALGASITYMRRYLYQLALDLIVNDEVEPQIDKNTNNPTPVEKKAPATPEKREEVKQELTASDDNASDMQLKGLKNTLKKLIAKDKEKYQPIATELAVKTNGFTKISKKDCEALVTKLNEKLEAI